MSGKPKRKTWAESIVAGAEIDVPKRKTWAESIEAGAEVDVATSLGIEKDMGPIIRNAFQAGTQNKLVEQLESFVEKKQVEIEELCKTHYEEFILAVDELRAIMVDANKLKNKLSRENLELQEVASLLLSMLDELLELYSIRKNVRQALETVKISMQVLTLCVRCNKLLSDGKFYPALNTLGLIEKDYLQDIPILPLKKVIGSQIPVIKSNIKRGALNDLNDWLVYIRRKEREIGEMAFRQAAAARQKDDEIRVRQKQAEEHSHSGDADFVYTLDAEPFDEDIVLEFDLTPLYRAHHIHASLCLEDQFRENYCKNRLLQLNLQFQIPSAQPFLEYHQGFFAQIVGFFIVEDRVLRTIKGLLSEDQVQTLWDTSVTKITSIIEVQISQIDTASHLLLIKDFVTLLGITLNRYGFQGIRIVEVLDNSRDRYHELLLGECRTQIANVLANDKYERMVLNNENEYTMSILPFHLQSTDILPAFPYVAPFSSSIPDICRIVRNYIEGSVSYLPYGNQMHFYDVVKQYLDKLLLDVLNESLIKINHGDTLSWSQAMQIAANVAMLERACDFFLWQVAESCGVPEWMIERPHVGLTAKAVIRVTQNTAYNMLLDLVNSELEKFLALMSNINWMTDDTPEDGNDYMLEIIVHLNSVMSTAQQILPLEALYKIGIGALQHISSSILAAFLNDNVKRFTINAVIGIDLDLKKLEYFAEEKFCSSGLIDLNKEVSLRDCLAEARQLIDLLLQPDGFVNSEIKLNSFSVLDHKMVERICEKLKDSPDRLFGSLTNKNSTQNARKKSMDILKRRLRDFS